MKTSVCAFFVAAILLCMSACAPTHTIKPLPNFVNAGLEPGDKVTVTTHSGETHEFEIIEIRGDLLVGEKSQFALRDIASIKKHAWSRPESPCGGETPLGCSVPLLVGLVSEAHSHYKGKFYDACAQHDYCYRHGFASYGMNRDRCDSEFLLGMQNLCPDAAVSKFGKVLSVLDGSLDSRRSCLNVASDYHQAVRRYGEEKFQTASSSSYCEYDGPPLVPVSAPQVSPTAKEPK